MYLLIHISLFSFRCCNLFLLLTMSALKCYKLKATTFLEIYNASFGSWALVLRVIYLINLTDQKRYMTKLK